MISGNINNTYASDFNTTKGTNFSASGKTNPNFSNSTDVNVSGSSNSEKSDYAQILRNTIEEMEENVKNGTIPKQTITIGAKTYTDDEWNKLMNKVDDAIESGKEAAREKAEKMDKEREKAELKNKERD